MMRLDDVRITPPTLLRERNVTSYHNTRGLHLGEAQAPCKPLYAQDGDTICLRVGGLIPRALPGILRTGISIVVIKLHSKYCSGCAKCRAYACRHHCGREAASITWWLAVCLRS